MCLNRQPGFRHPQSPLSNLHRVSCIGAHTSSVEDGLDPGSKLVHDPDQDPLYPHPLPLSIHPLLGNS